MPKIKISTISRLHKVACMVVAGIRDERIAAVVGLSLAGLATLKQRQDYKDLVQEVLTGSINRWDEELAGDVKALHNDFAVAVPVAMRTLLDTVMQKKDLKASLEAAKEILDRDPQQAFTKDHASVKRDDEGRPAISDKMLESLAGEADKIAQQATLPKEKIN